VHYGANGDSVAGQKETEEERLCTLELLRRIDSARPIVVLSPDPSNRVHRNAIQARALGKRIGRVSYDDNERAWKLLRQTGKPMLLARVKDVSFKNHGYVNVIVEGDELQESLLPSALEIEWRLWLTDLPLLPESEQLQAQQEVAYVLDNVYMPHLAEADCMEVKTYLDIWLENSWHDLSREARQKRALYIELLEAAEDKEVRQLAEALKEQRRRICEREPLDEMATEWWQQRQEGPDVHRLWQQWRLKNDNKLWAGLRLIDSLLRQLPGDLYGDIGQMDVVLMRLYYLNTPRKAFQSIMALLMMRCLTCCELGIDMRPMTEDEYEQDGIIKNPLDIPTTIARVVAFGATRCNDSQKQTIELLVHWLRDDYEQSHCEEIESLAADTQVRLANAIEKAANKPATQHIYGDKNEFQGGAQLLKMGLPEGADPAEIAARIAEQQQALLEQKKQKK
jgi:hypothetical protein